MVRAAEREGRRHALSLRVTEKTRRWIEEHASVEGRSITQEVEARLELQAMAEQAFGGSKNYRLLLALAQSIPEIEEAIGCKWYEDESGIFVLRITKTLAHIVDWQSMMMEEPSDKEHQEVSVDLGLAPSNPTAHLVGSEEAVKDFVSADDPKRPAAIFEGHDNAGLGVEMVNDDPAEASDNPPAPASPKRTRKAKASA